MSVRVPTEPSAPLVATPGAIREPASAAAIAMPVGARVNYVLGRHPHGTLAVHASVDGDGTRSVWHHPSDDCHDLLVVAVIAGCVVGQIGTLTVTVAGGAAVTIATTRTTATTDPWGRGWSVVTAAVPLVTRVGLVRHDYTTTDMHLHAITFAELPREVLASTGGDECAETLDGAWSGTETGRRITDSAVSGVQAMLDSIASANKGCRIHTQACWREADEWTKTTAKDTWEEIGAGETKSAAFVVPTRSRLLRLDTPDPPREVRIKAKKTGAGTCDVRMVGASDTVTCTAIAAGYAWLTPDGGATLDVAADVDDALKIEVRNDDGASSVEVCGWAAVEE